MFTENTAAFFADFGQTAQVNGLDVRGIFDAAYSLGAVGPFGMSGTQPALTLASADVPNAPEGKAVVVSGNTYTIATAKPDGTGITQLLLESAA